MPRTPFIIILSEESRFIFSSHHPKLHSRVVSLPYTAYLAVLTDFQWPNWSIVFAVSH